MNPDLEHLIVLQTQDLDLGRLRAELAEIPRRVKEAESKAAAAAKTVLAAKAPLAGEDKLRRGQESEIASLRTKVERLRRSLDVATSAAQVTAFEHEIGFAKDAVAGLEDEELSSMERTEVLEAELTRAQATATTMAEELATEQARAQRTMAEHKAQIAGLEHQRLELRAQVEERWLMTYDRLSKAKGSAVAEAIGNATQGKCAACQMGVRPQRWQDLTGRDHEDEIFLCEICGRLLFWDPRRDTPKVWVAGDRLREAQAKGHAGSPR